MTAGFNCRLLSLRIANNACNLKLFLRFGIMMDLPTLSINDPTLLKLEVGRSLRDDGWAPVAGRLQRLLDSPTTAKVELDFSRAEWADPLPLLALTCLIARAKSQRPQLGIDIRLGSITQADGDRFLVFASSHGFIRSLSAFCSISFQGRTFSTITIGDLEALIQQSKVVPAYTNADCIKASVLLLSDKTKLEISDTIDRLVYACSHCNQQFPFVDNLSSKDAAARVVADFREHVQQEHCQSRPF